jgi:endogenous inhibitor of DNA gyrase (YacG/DUF329 family)
LPEPDFDTGEVFLQRHPTGIFVVSFVILTQRDESVMKVRKKCPICKVSFNAVTAGRRRKFCSRACRQKAYRMRAARSPALKALESDLFRIRDNTARGNAAVRVLEELGFEVTLTRRKSPRPCPRKPGGPLYLV